VVDGVERGGQIETDQDGDLLVISRRVNTVEDIQQCSLGRVTSSVCRLVLAEVDGAVQMWPQSCQDESLQ